MARPIKDGDELKELTATVLHGLMTHEGLDHQAALQVLAFGCASLIVAGPKHTHKHSADATCDVLRRMVRHWHDPDRTVTFVRPEKAR